MPSFTEEKKIPLSCYQHWRDFDAKASTTNMENINLNGSAVKTSLKSPITEEALAWAEIVHDKIIRNAEKKAADRAAQNKYKNAVALGVGWQKPDALAAENFFLTAKRLQEQGRIVAPSPKEGGARPVFDMESCVPPHLRASAEKPNPPAEKRSKYNEKYKELINQMENGCVTNPALTRAARKWAADGTMIFQEKEGAAAAFEGWRKGAKRYQDAQTWALKDRCALMQASHERTFFITLTQAPLYRSANLLEDYANMSERVSKFCKEIQRHGDGQYAEVKEAHKDGHTHSHTALFTDKHFNEDTWEIMEKDGIKYIIGGDIWNFIAQYWDYGHFTIGYSENKSAASYLAKYMTKGHTSEFEQISKMNKLSSKRRKYLLGHFLPVLSGRRCFSSSSEKSIKTKALAKLGAAHFLGASEKARKNRLVNEISEAVLAAHAKDRAGAESAAGREAAAPLARHGRAGLLENASINFPCKRACGLRVLTQKQVSKFTRVPFPSIPKKSEPYLRALAQKATPIGCAGCVFSHLNNEISNLNDEWFHKNPQRLSDYEKCLLQMCVKDRRFPKIMYNPLQLDFRLLAWLAPWSKLADYVKEKAIAERLHKFSRQTKKNQTDSFGWSSHGKIQKEKVAFMDWEKIREDEHNKFDVSPLYSLHEKWKADNGVQKSIFLDYITRMKPFLDEEMIRWYGI